MPTMPVRTTHAMRSLWEAMPKDLFKDALNVSLTALMEIEVTALSNADIDRTCHWQTHLGNAPQGVGPALDSFSRPQHGCATLNHPPRHLRFGSDPVLLNDPLACGRFIERCAWTRAKATTEEGATVAELRRPPLASPAGLSSQD
jgi:hypothetical protein